MVPSKDGTLCGGFLGGAFGAGTSVGNLYDARVVVEPSNFVGMDDGKSPLRWTGGTQGHIGKSSRIVVEPSGALFGLNFAFCFGSLAPATSGIRNDAREVVVAESFGSNSGIGFLGWWVPPLPIGCWM